MTVTIPIFSAKHVSMDTFLPVGGCIPHRIYYNCLFHNDLYCAHKSIYGAHPSGHLQTVSRPTSVVTYPHAVNFEKTCCSVSYPNEPSPCIYPNVQFTIKDADVTLPTSNFNSRLYQDIPSVSILNLTNNFVNLSFTNVVNNMYLPNVVDYINVMPNSQGTAENCVQSDSFYLHKLKSHVCTNNDFHSSTNQNNNNDTLFLPGATLVGPVINLSSFQLTPAMISLLSKGLNFCPTPGEPDRYELRRDLDKFHVSLRRKLFFDKRNFSALDTSSSFTFLPDSQSDREEGPFDHRRFSNPSSWSPQGPFQLEAFSTFNEAFLNEYKFPTPSHHNLSYNERKALAELKQAKNIIIKPADKGSAVVIQNLDDYVNEGLRHLSDPDFYRETQDDLTFLHNEITSHLINHLHQSGEISDKCCKFLLNTSPRTPQLYLLPKIHKNKSPVPGRPIVSANNSPTERISQLADFFLQPLVQNTQSYVRDTTDFINKIEATPPLPEDCLLCTIDVCSLYTNIPNDEGINACRLLLNTHRQTSSCPSNAAVIQSLEHVLYMNNFDFNGKHYLQVGGTAMGTKVAPSLANIFMANFEDQWVYSYPIKPLTWLRYIDDIFMIWTHGHEALSEFMDHLNSCHKTIKFTSEQSPSSVNFLDTTVKIDSDRKLYTDLFCKPTDSHNYLLFESAHPKHLKNSLPYSQLLRIRRICSKMSDFDKNAILIGDHFIRRQYPEDLIIEAIIKTRRMDRGQLLCPPPKTTSAKIDDLFLISTFNPDCSPLKDIVQKTWPTLGRTHTTESVYNRKTIFGHRRNESLKDILVHAKIPSSTPSDNTVATRSLNRRCIAKKCRYCPRLDRSGQVTCQQSGNSYSTKTHTTCNSNNLIYCIICKTCAIKYVGQTKNAIKERFKCHFYSIAHPATSDTTIGRHFSAKNHHGIDDVQIFVLEFIRAPNESPASQRIRDEAEKKWIHRLASIAPLGLNSAD